MKPPSEVTRDPLESDLQEPVETELKRLGLLLTHRVYALLGVSLTSEPAWIKASEGIKRVRPAAFKTEIRAAHSRRAGTKQQPPQWLSRVQTEAATKAVKWRRLR